MSERLRVYVAGPLSGSGDRLANVRNAIAAGLELIRCGFAPLVPHLTHYMDGDDALGHETWLSVDLPWVSVADVILRLPGESSGADREVTLAGELGVPRYYAVCGGVDAAVARMAADRDAGSLKSRCVNECSECALPGDQRFHAILAQLSALHARKAADYGTDTDPFANIRASVDWGIEAFRGALVRLGDKVQRIKTFARKGTLANEGVEDSLMDLASYAVIALVLFREESRHESGGQKSAS